MIVVLGSINVDLVVQVDRLPGAGETVLGSEYRVYAGGKGANQALAARRAGAAVVLIGAVGQDSFAGPALALLEQDGVDLSRVASVQGPTGIAMIAVDSRKENQIVVASGANRFVSPDALRAAIKSGDLLLLQFELPLPTVTGAARLARAAGAKVMLNAAPAHPIPRELAELIDILVVNEHEAAVISAGLELPASSPETFARTYAATTGTAVVVTLGARGALAVIGEETFDAVPPPVDVVDTTGAGDAFIGGLAAALESRRPFHEALAFAVAGGALAVTAHGAQPSFAPATEIAAAVLMRRG